jgi:hypothetical protein
MAIAAPLALVAGGIGAGVSAYGQVEAGQATANAANYQAAVASNNAIIANQNADYAVAAGQAEAAMSSMKGAAQVGRIKTAQAASGVDVNTGSAVAVQAGQREVNKLDSETLLNNAELKAYGYRSQATGYTAQAGLESLEAEQAPLGADIGAAGGLLGSASSLGLKWAQLGTSPGGSSDVSSLATGLGSGGAP